MSHHAHKSADTTLEEDTWEIMCLDSLYTYNNTDYFYLDKEEIYFLLPPQNMESQKNLEQQHESSINMRSNLNKASSYWKYNTIKVINLVQYRDMIYVPKTIYKHFLKWNHCYLQNSGDYRLAQTLPTVCRWFDVVDQAKTICRICKDCHKFKNMIKPWYHGIKYV